MFDTLISKHFVYRRYHTKNLTYCIVVGTMFLCIIENWNMLCFENDFTVIYIAVLYNNRKNRRSCNPQILKIMEICKALYFMLRALHGRAIFVMKFVHVSMHRNKNLPHFIAVHRNMQSKFIYMRNRKICRHACRKWRTYDSTAVSYVKLVYT